MKRTFFRRFGAWLLAALLLLSALAVPVVAEDSAGSTDGSRQTGYAVSGFDNIKTTGANLRGSFQYTTGVTGAQLQLPGYLVTLQPNTWYYLKYTESVVMTGSAANSYVFYRQGKEVFSYLGSTRPELLFYTGTGSGACQLLLQGSKSDIGINQYSLYQVASFDMLYDVRYTSFSEDHAELFPEIDLSKYKDVTGDFIELITVYENISIAEDYTWDGQVYLYLFNASGKQVTGGTLTCPDDDGNSASFSMVPVVSGNPFGETIDWRFLKLEVTGHWWHQYRKNADGTVNIHSRKREITDLTLTYADKTSKTFPYNGFFLIEDKQENGKVTGAAVTGDFEAKVNLEINYTYYRTDTSPNGAYYHNQVDSIYFNVPNYLKETYGKLVDVKLSYQRARTQPIIVTENAGIYKALQGNLLQDATTYNSKIPELWWVQQIGVGQNKSVLGFSYNVDLTGRNAISNRILSPLRSVFLVDDVHAGVRASGSSVSRSELTDWMYTYSKKYPDISPIQGANGSVSSHFFSEVEDAAVINVAALNLKAESYGSNHGFLDKFCNYGLWYAINGSPSDYDLDLSQAIVEIGTAHQIIGKSDVLYFAEADEGNLRNCFEKAKANDSTMYLVRFNVSQYYQRFLASRFNGSTCNDGDGSVAYVAEQDVYLNLHVLELTYENDLGVETVVPVVSNRIDGIADITDEKDPEQINQEAGQNLFQNLMDKLGQIGKLFALILGIVVLVLIVVFVVPVVSPIFKAIFGAIGKVFRWIRDKIRGASTKRKQRKNNRK